MQVLLFFLLNLIRESNAELKQTAALNYLNECKKIDAVEVKKVGIDSQLS